MDKLYAMSVLYKGPNDSTVLKAAFELQSFSFFQRSSAQEFMCFATKTIVERTASGARQSIKQKEYFCHVYVRSDNLAGVLISHDEYPHLVAHILLTKTLDEFSAKFLSYSWSSLNETQVTFNELNTMLAKYQNPKEAYSLMKRQQNLKITLHNRIEAVLKPGENLDDLVAKSEELSMPSKALYIAKLL
ncbi:Longin domain,Longin-like domain [Cinara cedri]|uniref:Longin domain,Longin-like domain n=1 Tax=Cinara cedri TaxID=506608 RepID=A0A5E4NER7_9HEMI|nr:Longin domain,Longin-like domain [Cinara cedri]